MSDPQKGRYNELAYRVQIFVPACHVAVEVYGVEAEYVGKLVLLAQQ